jgi:hypothetical protein
MNSFDTPIPSGILEVVAQIPETKEYACLFPCRYFYTCQLAPASGGFPWKLYLTFLLNLITKLFYFLNPVIS